MASQAEPLGAPQPCGPFPGRAHADGCPGAVSPVLVACRSPRQPGPGCRKERAQHGNPDRPAREEPTRATEESTHGGYCTETPLFESPIHTPNQLIVFFGKERVGPGESQGVLSRIPR